MTAPVEAPRRKTIGVVGAAFVGLGSMVGAGIFALLGQAGAIAGSAVWVSFLIAGLIAMGLGYAAANLGVRFPSSGGLVAYLIEAFGKGHVTGVASSVNANLFAAGNITSLLARERLFPPLFAGRALGGPRGLVVSAAGVLVLANVFDLTAIARSAASSRW